MLRFFKNFDDQQTKIYTTLSNTNCPSDFEQVKTQCSSGHYIKLDRNLEFGTGQSHNDTFNYWCVQYCFLWNDSSIKMRVLLNGISLSVFVFYFSKGNELVSILLYLNCPLMRINTELYVFLNKIESPKNSGREYQVDFGTTNQTSNQIQPKGADP